ncbi:MAG TPA: BTAD domain-containing putative transcriptional regulator, partial [Micromonosporaceae bacterium]|nr:BTAD domain-containing putative transcriptional regulator [Micromonosporaceae bacterium]
MAHAHCGGGAVESASTLLQFQVLGPVKASLGRSEINLGAPKQRAVLALLALRPSDRVALEDMVYALWGSNPPTSAANLVHTYVARLRQILEPDMPQRRRNNVIISVPGGYRLVVAEDRLDLCRFRGLTRRAAALIAAQDEERAFDLLGQALYAWQDPMLTDLIMLLPGYAEIDLLRQELVTAGLTYVGLGLDHGRARTVLPEAERLARIEPLNETVQARYLIALARSGHRAVAVTRYAEVRARLAEELGVGPSELLSTAYREVLDTTGADDATPVPATPVPARPPWRGPGPAVGELVGRRDDLDNLLYLLNRHRLVTLTGPVGVGKSALALALADAARDSFTNGVAVVDLSPARARSDVAAAVGEVVGHTDRATPAGPGRILQLLAGHQLLLVLDNAELAVDEAAILVDDILRGCPHVRVVATSREVFGIAYEAVHRVRPLAVGEPEGGVPGRGPAPLDRQPAVQLFAHRAAQVNSGFRLTDANVTQVAAICRELDGLPLAIELAAASLRTWSLWTL